MPTTSSFPADRRRTRLLAAGVVLLMVLAGCAVAPPPARAAAPGAPVTPVSPESPRPARTAGTEVAVQPGTTGADQSAQSVELRAVVARRVERAEAARMAGESFAAAAREPLALEVTTERPLGNLARDSSPVIVLNGKRLTGTVAHPPNRLVAVLPDRGSLAETNTVEVVWLGDETRTRTRKPLTLRASDVK